LPGNRFSLADSATAQNAREKKDGGHGDPAVRKWSQAEGPTQER